MNRMRSRVACVLVVVVTPFAMFCSSRDGDILSRLNPLDAKSDKENTSPPAISSSLIALDTVWETFDFADSTGAIACSLLQPAAYAGLAVGHADDSLEAAYSGNEMRFLAYGLHTGTTYHFRAVAYSRAGDSLVDSGSFVSPEGPPPPVPGKARAAGDTAGIRLTWNAASAAVEYVVYRVDSTGTADSLVAVVDTRAYHDPIPDFESHTYRIAARNRYGESPQTPPLSARRVIPLSPPEDAAASQGIHGDWIALSWDKVPAAAGYAVFRAPSDTSEYGRVGATTDTVFLDSIDETETFYYRIASTDAAGRTGMPSAVVMGFLADTIDVPPDLNASEGVYKTHIALSWGSVDSAGGYVLYRSDRSDREFSAYDTLTDTTFHDSVKAPTDFHYRISAYDRYGIETARSTAVTGSLKAIRPPTGITASDVAYVSHVEVSWDSVRDAGKYVVYRSRYADSAYQVLDTVSGTSYHDSGATTVVAYYTVSSIERDGEESVRGKYDAGRCRTVGTPTGIDASDRTYFTHIRIEWNTVQGAAGYNVYRSSNSSSGFELIGHTDTTYYDDSVNVKALYSYYYKVAAYGSDGKEGARSESVSGKLRRISTPGGVSASSTFPEYVRISWNEVADAEGYYVYRAPVSSGAYSVFDTTADTVLLDTLTDRTYAFYRVAAYTTAGAGQSSDRRRGQLQVPPKLTAQEKADHVHLSWTEVEVAEQYGVYRAGSVTGTYERLAKATGLHYNDTVTAGRGYYYKVSAINEYGETRLSSARFAKLIAGPSALTATLNGKSVKLEWQGLPEATVYYLYHSTSADTGYTYLAAFSDTFATTSISVSGTYYYKVRARVSSQLTTYSNTASVVAALPPNRPNYVSSTGHVGYVSLFWSDNSSGEASGYIVYRSSSSTGDYVAIDTTELTTCADSSMTEIRRYYYKVSAYNANGESSLSPYTSDSPVRPSSPSGLTASYGLYGTHIELTWNPDSNVDGYIIFRAKYYSGTYTRIDSTTDTFYHDSTVPVDAVRNYRIASYGPLGESDRSTYEAGVILDYPSSVSANGHVSHIRISWSSVSYAKDYIVYRSTSATGTFTRLDSTSSTAYYDTVSTPDYYYYKVVSRNRNESEPSPVSNRARRSAPSAPSLVSASRGTLPKTVAVTWRKVNGAESYELYRSPTETFNAEAQLCAGTTDTTVEDSVASDSLYYYRVKAVNGAGESLLSSTVVNGYRSQSSAPTAPGGLTASDSIASHIGLLWNSSPTDIAYAGYVVYRSESAGGPYAVVDSTVDTTYADYAPASFPTYYWYVVKAYNTTGESAASNEANGTRQ